MSFLADPPLLVASGVAIDSVVSDEDTAKKLEMGTLIVFLLVSISLYLNLGWVKRFWQFFGAKSGRDFMINSGVLPFNSENTTARKHLVSVAIFSTYPLWLRMGRKLGARMRANRLEMHARQNTD
ncbi:MAG: hypothetical protein ACYDGY_05635 [Acidimicrobiales bacterium]